MSKPDTMRYVLEAWAELMGLELEFVFERWRLGEAGHPLWAAFARDMRNARDALQQSIDDEENDAEWLHHWVRGGDA